MSRNACNGENGKHLGKMMNNHQIDNNIINKIAKGSFGSGDFGENGAFGKNSRHCD